ncbi:YfgM family protein [Dasania marina]|uniref:YfgM family protein n=1 Tax=Dasania marina TaxID=471499 RepID=UPI00035F44DE|nr:tetratricopeptide repeat protein [Dasania marina]|tara:strand:- start:87599 stop:88267 length:669 start_codon:yes stop_codon:yes gene_type:complete
MSTDYQNDEEQIEAIKRWWKENGKSTLTGIALAIAAGFGWQGWQKQQQESAYAASSAYQNLLAVVAKDQAPLNDEQMATANYLADKVKNDYASSSYAQLAALYKAQLAVKASNLVDAETELRWVLAQSPTAEIKAQAQLRLAKVLLATEKYPLALAELAQPIVGFKPLYAELKGDILLAQGDEAAARAAYQQAKDLATATAGVSANNLLELKIQQLKVAEGV